MTTLALYATLAQDTAPQQKDPTQLMILGAVALASIFTLILIVAAVRKKFFPKEAADSAPAGFGVSQLKELYDQGLLTDDEFNAAKARIVAESHAAFMTAKKGKDEKARK